MITTIKITERKSIHKFCNNIGLCYLELTPDYVVKEINDKTALLFGFEKKNILRKSLLDYCHFSGLSCPIAMQKNKQLPFESTHTDHISRNGSVMHIQWNIIMIIDEHNILCGWILTGKVKDYNDNISKMKQLHFLRNIIDNFPLGVYFKSTKGEYLFGNNYFYKISGFKKDNEIFGRNDYDMPWMETAAELMENDKKVLIKGGIIFEEPAVLSDGKKHKMLSTKSVVTGTGGEIIGTIGLSLSLTNFKYDKLLEENWLENLDNNRNIHLTKREIECVNWLTKGKSAAEIAILLKVSRRTIESHINNIKYKTQCFKQFQLSYFLGQYGEMLL